MHHTPNLFKHATSELSQDAFLAWMCEWADEVHAEHPSGMHKVGRAFIAWLHEKHGVPVPDYATVEVKLQYLHIDVLVILRSSTSGAHYVLIEDKIHTTDHADQIGGYLNALREKEGITEAVQILPVYFKSSLEPLKSDGFLRLYLPEIVAFLTTLDLGTIQSEVFHSWRNVRTDTHASHERFRAMPIHEWQREQWYGCFDHMARQDALRLLEPGYGYVPLGDFIGFWLGWEGEPNDWCTYLQVDAAPAQAPTLTFRIAAPKGDLVSPAYMQGAFSNLQSAALSLGKCIHYPKWARMGGKSSRFALLDEPFMSEVDGGMFDESLMMSQLLACRELLARAPISSIR